MIFAHPHRGKIRRGGVKFQWRDDKGRGHVPGHEALEQGQGMEQVVLLPWPGGGQEVGAGAEQKKQGGKTADEEHGDGMRCYTSGGALY